MSLADILAPARARGQRRREAKHFRSIRKALGSSTVRTTSSWRAF